jgi:hypothetical protein
MIILELASPSAASAECHRSRPGDQFYAVDGLAMIARGESRILWVCSVKAVALDAITFSPADGLSVEKIEEIGVPDSLAKLGVRPRKDHHLFLVTVRAASDAPVGKRTFVPVYTGSNKEKPDTLFVATHLPLLLDATVVQRGKGKYDIVAAVLDSLHDVTGPTSGNRWPLTLAMTCEGSSFVNGNLATVNSLYLAPIDSVQVSDANTTRIFSHWHDRSNCSGTVVVRDAQGNESPVRKTLAFEKT